MKRKIVIMFFAMAFTVAVYSQVESEKPVVTEQDQIQTLFKHSGPLGWWVAPEFSYTMIDKKSALLGGLSAGIIINHELSLGLAGMGIITSNSLKFSGINDTADVYLYGGYGGLRLEYRLKALDPVNIAFPLLIGGGGAVYSTWGPNEWNNSNGHEPEDDVYSWDGYFVLEPGVVVGINLFKFMRLDLGATYRYCSGLDLPGTDKTLMNGFNGTFSLKFGRF